MPEHLRTRIDPRDRIPPSTDPVRARIYRSGAREVVIYVKSSDRRNQAPSAAPIDLRTHELQQRLRRVAVPAKRDTRNPACAASACESPSQIEFARARLCLRVEVSVQTGM